MTTETSTAAPAPVVTTATVAPVQVAQVSQTGTIDPPDATLAVATKDYLDRKLPRKNRGKEPTVGDKVAALVEPSAAAAETPATTTDEAAAVTSESAKVEAAKEEAAPPAKEDEVPAALAQYLRDKRAVGRRAAEVAKQQEQIAKDREEIEAARKSSAEQVERVRRFDELKARDPLKAIEELVGLDALKGTLPFDLLARSAEIAGEDNPTPERIVEAAAARAKLEIMQEQAAKDEAAKKLADENAAKAAEAKKAANQRGRDAFFVGLKAEFEEVRDRYPFLATEGYEPEAYDKFMQAYFDKSGQLPTSETIFKHFDAVREKEAEAQSANLIKKRGWEIIRPDAAKPTTASAAVVPGVRVDNKGKSLTVAPARESPTQRIERIARELDQHQSG